MMQTRWLVCLQQPLHNMSLDILMKHLNDTQPMQMLQIPDGLFQTRSTDAHASCSSCQVWAWKDGV